MIRPINKRGVELVKSFEGLEDGDPTTVNLDPYMDPVGIWTIGWGHAIRYNGKFLRGKENRMLARSLYPGGLTTFQAEDLLRADLLDTCRDVEHMTRTISVTDNQFAALVSFAFNCGSTDLKNSTLMRRLLAGSVQAASEQFARWNKAGGKVLNGLTRRREAERVLFLS
jgi:lysozyme